MTRRSDRSPSSPYLRLPQMTHSTVSGDFLSNWHPLWGRGARCCPRLRAPSQREWVTVPYFGLKPTHPSNATENRHVAGGEHREHPSSALSLVTTQTRWLLLYLLIIEIYYLFNHIKFFRVLSMGFLCLFCFKFPTHTKTTTMLLQHTHFLEAFAVRWQPFAAVQLCHIPSDKATR